MIDVDAFTARRVELEAKKNAAKETLKEAKKLLTETRNVSNRATGQKLPEAPAAQQAYADANAAYKLAEQASKAANLAFDFALKEEGAAIKEKEQEDALNESMSGYDLALTESDEYFGVFYDENSRYVGFDIGIAGRAEASFNVSNREDLEKVIATLTKFAQKMP